MSCLPKTNHQEHYVWKSNVPGNKKFLLQSMILGFHKVYSIYLG